MLKLPSIDTLTGIGDLRDTVLLIGGGVYACGYAVWAIYAWRESLGPIPALDSQYFVAGLPTAAVLGVTLGVVLALRWALHGRWPSLVASLSGRSRVRVRVGLMAVIALTQGGGWFLVEVLGYEMSADAPGFMLGALWIVLFMTPLLLFLEVLPDSWRVPLAFQLGYSEMFYKLVIVYCAPAMLGAGMLLFYVQDFYPSIPQELGGARPRHAVLDLDPASFSSPTLMALGVDLPQSQPAGTVVPSSPSASPVLVSADVRVLFAASTFLVIEPAAEEPDGTRWELSRTGVKAIHWRERID